MYSTKQSLSKRNISIHAATVHTYTPDLTRVLRGEDQNPLHLRTTAGQVINIAEPKYSRISLVFQSRTGVQFYSFFKKYIYSTTQSIRYTVKPLYIHVPERTSSKALDSLPSLSCDGLCQLASLQDLVEFVQRSNLHNKTGISIHIICKKGNLRNLQWLQLTPCLFFYDQLS